MRRSPFFALLVLTLTACGSNGFVAARDPRTSLQLRDAATGVVTWVVALPDEAGATEPVLAPGLVIVADPAGQAVAYALADGREVSRGGGALPEAVGNGVAVFDSTSGVEARRLRDGAVLWRMGANVDVVRSREGGALVVVTDPGQPSTAPSCGSMTNPCLVEPRRDGAVQVSLLDPVTGRARWTASLQEHYYAFRAAVSSDLVLLTQPGHERVIALRLRDGAAVWTYEGRYIAGVVTSGAHVAVALDNISEKLDSANGKGVWRAHDSGPIEGPFIGASARKGFLRDPRTGHARPGEVAFDYGLAYQGDLLVGASQSSLTALLAGKEIWRSRLPAGERPGTLIDTDGRYVASITATGQKVYRD
jgi:hypothetical protein